MASLVHVEIGGQMVDTVSSSLSWSIMRLRQCSPPRNSKCWSLGLAPAQGLLVGSHSAWTPSPRLSRSSADSCSFRYDAVLRPIGQIAVKKVSIVLGMRCRLRSLKACLVKESVTIELANLFKAILSTGQTSERLPFGPRRIVAQSKQGVLSTSEP